MNEERPNDLSYDDDFYGWANAQAMRLRAGDWRALDAINIAEEIEALGRSEAAALRSSLRLIAMHLLKFRYQPRRASRSWRVTVERERINLERGLEESPSLKPKLPALFEQAYADARRLAAAETRLPIASFPAEAPFSLDEVRTGAIPEATAHSCDGRGSRAQGHDVKRPSS